MSSMKQMQHFTRDLKAKMEMILDASVRGTIRIKNENELKELIERMCQNVNAFGCLI